MKTLEKREWIGVAVAILATVILFFGQTIWNYVVGTKSSDSAPVAGSALTSTGTSTASDLTVQNISTIKGVEIYDLRTGTGTEAIAGKKVTTHYVGTFADGTKFDSSLDRGTPYSFMLGGGTVIKGWDVGLVGMKVGGIRALVISPEYGYGKETLGSIPGNSTLVFQVQLLEVK